MLYCVSQESRHRSDSESLWWRNLERRSWLGGRFPVPSRVKSQRQMPGMDGRTHPLGTRVSLSKLYFYPLTHNCWWISTHTDLPPPTWCALNLAFCIFSQPGLGHNQPQGRQSLPHKANILAESHTQNTSDVGMSVTNNNRRASLSLWSHTVSVSSGQPVVTNVKHSRSNS